MADWTLLRPYWGLIWCVPLVLQLWHWHRQHSGQSFINSRLLGYLRQQGEQQASRPLRWLWLPWRSRALSPWLRKASRRAPVSRCLPRP